MTNMRVRKEKAGGSSGRTDGKPWSYQWDEDGAVVEVPHAVATELINHPGWDYSAAPDEPETAGEDGEQVQEPGPDEDNSVEEPAPAADLSEAPGKGAGGRKPAAKKAADGK